MKTISAFSSAHREVVRCHQCHGAVRMISTYQEVAGPCPYCQALLATREAAAISVEFASILSAITLTRCHSFTAPSDAQQNPVLGLQREMACLKSHSHRKIPGICCPAM